MEVRKTAEFLGRIAALVGTGGGITRGRRENANIHSNKSMPHFPANDLSASCVRLVRRNTNAFFSIPFGEITPNPTDACRRFHRLRGELI
jgi:hypothetical protein